MKRQNAQRLEQIDRQMATVEAAILRIVEANASLSNRFAILTSIPGVSNVTAFALLIAMPELGALEAGQAASLAGLAPIARQSGRWTGRSFIRGGRADVRQALYMPALVAARFNPDMKAKYDTSSKPENPHSSCRGSARVRRGVQAGTGGDRLEARRQSIPQRDEPQLAEDEERCVRARVRA